MLKPFLLLLVITVTTQTNDGAGVSITTERFYVPSEQACKEVKELFEEEHTWEYKTYPKLIHWEHTNSIAKATCIPMRGVQHMPGDK